MTRSKAMSRLSEALVETADDMLRLGIMDEETHRDITSRHLPEERRPIEISVPTGEDIRAMREKANLSQALFARKLHLSTGYVSQLERGVRRPSGPTLVLLDLIRKRGIEAIQ